MKPPDCASQMIWKKAGSLSGHQWWHQGRIESADKLHVGLWYSAVRPTAEEGAAQDLLNSLYHWIGPYKNINTQKYLIN